MVDLETWTFDIYVWLFDFKTNIYKVESISKVPYAISREKKIKKMPSGLKWKYWVYY